MNCLNCGHEQESGKFCGKCGSTLEAIASNGNPTAVPPVNVNPVQPETEQSATTSERPVTPMEPNVHVESVKEKSKVYFSYFTRYLKQPSLAYNRGEAEFSNSLISIFLLVALISLSLFTFASKMYNSFSYGYGPGFLSFFSSVFIFITVGIGIVVFTLFLINKFFGPQLSFNAIVGLYGAHLSPLLIVAIISLVLMGLSSFTYGNIMLSLVFFFAIFVLPLYLMSLLLTKKSSSIDPLYSFFLYIIVFAILFFIFITILADSSIGSYLDELMPSF